MITTNQTGKLSEQARKSLAKHNTGSLKPTRHGTDGSWKNGESLPFHRHGDKNYQEKKIGGYYKVISKFNTLSNDNA